MKYLTVLTILSVVLLTSAAPCRDHSNHEDNSHHSNKEITQVIGTVGSQKKSGGLLGNLLGDGILSSTTTNNYVTQNAHID